MSTSAFPVLEQTILKAKGLNEAQMQALNAAGVVSKKDFATIGSAETLLEVMPELSPEVAKKVMEWAVGAPAAAAAVSSSGAGGLTDTAGTKFFVDSADAVYCVHCNARQPKDYKTGDLCPTCGKQAEPVQSCYWCAQSGPGKFCRGCGAEFVPLAEFDLAVLLKREGVAKEEISRRLKGMTPADKDILWGRVRRIHS
jgi:hypothetical protein